MHTGFSLTQHTAFTGHCLPTQETPSPTWVLTQVPYILLFWLSAWILKQPVSKHLFWHVNLFQQDWSVREDLEHHVNLCLCMHDYICRKLHPADRALEIRKTHRPHTTPGYRGRQNVWWPHPATTGMHICSVCWSPSFLYFTTAHQLSPLAPMGNQQTPNLLQGKMPGSLWYAYVSSSFNVYTTLYHFY